MAVRFRRESWTLSSYTNEYRADIMRDRELIYNDTDEVQQQQRPTHADDAIAQQARSTSEARERGLF